MRSILVIINPIAGVRPKDEIPALVRKVMPQAEGFDVDIRFTERAGHASEMAREAVSRGVDTVVAIGGDGTINETGRSLVGSPVKFGIVPMGSGNGLARHIQVPLDITKALECIRDGYSEALDYGTVNDHIFFCTAGIGFDAQVSAKFAEAGSRGPVTYLRSFMQLVGNYKPSTYVIYTDDGRVKEKAFLIAIGNASQWGNNAYITPNASMSDGILDVTLVKPMPLYEIPRMAYQLFTRQLNQNAHVDSVRSSHLRIIMPQPNVVHVDGEPIRMEGVLDIQIHPKQLRVIFPEHPSSSVLEPIRYAFEDVHYAILGNVKKGVRSIEETNRQALLRAEVARENIVQRAEVARDNIVQRAKEAGAYLGRLAKPNAYDDGDFPDDEEPMQEP